MLVYEYTAKLVRVIDGDTVVLDVDFGFHMRGLLTFRLYGINTPERGETGWASATAYLTERLDRTTDLRIRTHKGQTFGRWLATLYDGEHSINDELVEHGFAVVYRA